ncbi:MAG: hypothetical protein JHC95_06460 [Solirubrobacteraceae bacterium]|nr:hypothetical protein [Solirubrobacteraceae bacterium]
MGRVCLVVALATFALLASAAPGFTKGSGAAERSAARAFADAAAELTTSVRKTAPTVRVNREAIQADCFAKQQVRARQEGLVPPAVLAVAATQGNAIIHELIYEPTIPPLERFVARLDGIRTSDPILRAGRTAWRGHLAAFRLYAQLNVPTDLCAQVTAWVDGGGTSQLLPSVDFAASLRELQTGGVGKREQRMRRAAARLKDRGQTAKRAGRFAFATAYAEHVAIYSSLLDSYGFPG